MLFVLAPASSRNLHAQQRPVQAWLPGGSVSTPTTNCTPTNEESPFPTDTSLRLLLLLPSTWREQLRITRGPVCKVGGASRPRRDIKLGGLRKLMMADKSKRSFTCLMRWLISSPADASVSAKLQTWRRSQPRLHSPASSNHARRHPSSALRPLSPVRGTRTLTRYVLK